MNNSLIPCNFSVIEENDTLVKVKLRVVRDGINSNNCAFDLESIQKAEKTCCNIPILAHIRKDDLGNLDFDDHNIITKLVTTPEGLKLEEYYIEQPIGLVPETNEATYEEIDGQTWLSVTGYIWKGYSNEALSIIDNSDFKGISMEIKVLNGSKDDNGIYNISDFIFRGITVLGDHVRPAIDGAKLERFSSNMEFDYSKEMLEFSKKLDETFRKEDTVMADVKDLNIEEEVFNTEDNSINNEEMATQEEASQVEEVIEPVETKEEETQEEAVEVEEVEAQPETEEATDAEETVEEEVETESTEETSEVEETVEDMNFSLSFDNIYALIEKELASHVVTRKDWDGEEYETNRYWLRTILPLESIAIIEDREDNWNTLGVKYTIENDTAILDMESMVEFISTWRAKKTDEVAPKNFSLEAQAVKELADKKIASLVSEIEELRTFKAETEKAQLTVEVNAIISEFNFSDEEVADVKVQAIEGEISLEGLKKELFALEGMKAFSKRAKFSTETATSTKVKVQKSFENEDTIYGSLTRFLDK